MEIILSALKSAQAVLTDYLAPTAPQVPRAPIESAAYWRNQFNDNEKVIHQLLVILDNKELVEQQRACKKLNGHNTYSAAIRTLEKLGYKYNPGSELWQPPIVTPAPDWFDPNVEAVRKMLLDRSAFGFKKYGCTTANANLELADWLQHMQEELCDAVVYIQAAKTGANPHREELDKAYDEIEVLKKERDHALRTIRAKEIQLGEIKSALKGLSI